MSTNKPKPKPSSSLPLDIIVYKVSDMTCRPIMSKNVFNCHICKARHSSYPAAEGHYLTQHTNVIVVLQENGKLHINRHFVGPRSRRPKYLMEKSIKPRGRPKVALQKQTSLQSEKIETNGNPSVIPLPLSETGTESVKDVSDEHEVLPSKEVNDYLQFENLEACIPLFSDPEAAEELKAFLESCDFGDSCHEPPKKKRKLSSETITPVLGTQISESKHRVLRNDLQENMDMALDILGDITLDEILEYSLLVEHDSLSIVNDANEGMDLLRA